MNLPNKLTILRILMIPFFMLLILPLPEAWGLTSYNEFVLTQGKTIAGIIFVLAALTDSLDGHIARSRNLITDFGKFLDPIADKLLVTAALIALVQIGDISGYIALIILTREFIVTGIRLVAATQGTVIAASNWGKIKMILQTLALVFYLFNNFPFKYLTDVNVAQILMILAVFATIYSGFEYVYKNRHLIIHTK